MEIPQNTPRYPHPMYCPKRIKILINRNTYAPKSEDIFDHSNQGKGMLLASGG